jgi:hypothetical protein
VVANRALYREKFAQVTPLLAEVLDVRLPDAGFYLWAGVPGRTARRRRHRLRPLPAGSIQCPVLPGSLLAREAHGTTRAPAASAWPWWPAPTNAWRPPSAHPRSPCTYPNPCTDDHQLQNLIDLAWEGRAKPPHATPPPRSARPSTTSSADLNAGRIRVAERQGVGQWQVNQWVKKAVLLSFRLNDNQVMRPAT